MQAFLLAMLFAAQPPVPPVREAALPDRSLYPSVPLAKLAAKDGWVRPRALVKGKVTLAKKEDDGDYHFRLEADGKLVVLEIIPELPLKDHPKVGQTIEAWGVARWDGEHEWGELHPLIGWRPTGAKAAATPYEWRTYANDPDRVYLFRDGQTAGAWDYARGKFAEYDGEWHFWADVPEDAPAVPQRSAAVAPTFQQDCPT